MNFSKCIGNLFLILISIHVFSACGNENKRNTPNVSGLKPKVSIQRFEQDLFALDTNQLETALPALEQKYPALYEAFTKYMIHDQTNPNETPVQAVRSFISIPEIRTLNDTVQQVYGDLSWLEKELSEMFGYHKYYFPQKPYPQVATVVSEFASDAFAYGDSLYGIGLDLFLGEKFRGYNPEVFPYYVRRQFVKEYIPVKLAKVIAKNAFSETTPGTRLIDLMLYNGKMLYVVDCLLPEVPDSLKMGYTRAQMEGSEANEPEVWARLLKEKLLYSSDYELFKKLVSPSPNAPVVFQEAPGEIGNWIGWQIVKAYMKRHPETSLDALLQMKDSQKFLEQAKYKPKNE
jgi:hypothetical protein